jgi:hypothetical protein
VLRLTFVTHRATVQSIIQKTPLTLALFKNEFADTTTVPVTYDELVAAREKCIVTINAEMTEDEQRFLVSVKEGAPEWELLGLPGTEALPAIRWKVANIVRMDRAKHADMLAQLRVKLRL